MLLAYFTNHLTKNIIYNFARGMSFDLNMAFKVEMSKNWGLSKYFP